MFSVQRGIRAVKLSQLSVGSFLRINTVVILFGDVIRGYPWVVQTDMEGCILWKKFVGACMRYQKFTNCSQKISKKWRKRYNCRLWKMQMWSHARWGRLGLCYGIQQVNEWVSERPSEWGYLCIGIDKVKQTTMYSPNTFSPRLDCNDEARTFVRLQKTQTVCLTKVNIRLTINKIKL